MKMKKLTARQEAALKRHKVHHTAKHMSEMRKSMRAGKTFKEAHRAAMRKVGKKEVSMPGHTMKKMMMKKKKPTKASAKKKKKPAMRRAGRMGRMY